MSTSTQEYGIISSNLHLPVGFRHAVLQCDPKLGGFLLCGPVYALPGIRCSTFWQPDCCEQSYLPATKTCAQSVPWRSCVQQNPEIRLFQDSWTATLEVAVTCCHLAQRSRLCVGAFSLSGGIALIARFRDRLPLSQARNKRNTQKPRHLNCT